MRILLIVITGLLCFFAPLIVAYAIEYFRPYKKGK